MKRRSFLFTSEQDAQFEKFTALAEITIKGKPDTVIGNGGILSSIVYFEDLTEITTKEKTKLTWIKEKATDLALDEKYQKLSNATQRNFLPPGNIRLLLRRFG
jgi:preprotein translocase subunit YajC